MFGKGIRLFEVFGFEVRADFSWIFIALLLIWTLSSGFFPTVYEGLSSATYWWMGIAATIGFFACLLLHELAHSLVARRYGMTISGIKLWLFGGVAEMQDEPPTARAELHMAAAGPVMSYLLGGVLFGLAFAADGLGAPQGVYGVLRYVATMNLILATFNLLPAFPLDGGRIFRALLWGRRGGNLRRATRLASRVGSYLGLALIAVGIYFFFQGNFIGGLWWALIGMFVRAAAAGSYQQLLTRRVLAGEHVRRFMTEAPATIPPWLTIERFVDEYVHTFHHDFYPVTEHGRILGCVSLKETHKFPREEWAQHTVAEIATACTPDNTVRPEEDAMKVLALMRRTGNTRLMVTEGGRLLGVIALKDLMEFLSMRLPLDDDDL